MKKKENKEGVSTFSCFVFFLFVIFWKPGTLLSGLGLGRLRGGQGDVGQLVDATIAQNLRVRSLGVSFSKGVSNHSPGNNFSLDGPHAKSDSCKGRKEDHLG